MNRSWKTTVVSVAMAVLLAIQPLIDFANGESINWMQVGFAALVALFGALSKDADKTGLPEK